MGSKQCVPKRKQPKKRNPAGLKYQNQAIRQLREIVGDSQREFARRVGVSRDFIISVENGRCGVSEKFLSAVMQATGAECFILSEKATKVPWMPLLISPVQYAEWDESGRKLKTLRNYTKKDFERWQKRFDGSEESGRKIFESISGWLEIMFTAAGKVRRQAQLWDSLCHWMDKSRTVFALEPHIDAVLRENARAGAKVCREWRPRSGVPPVQLKPPA